MKGGQTPADELRQGLNFDSTEEIDSLLNGNARGFESSGGEEKGRDSSSVFPRSQGDGTKTSSDRTPLLLDQDEKRSGTGARFLYRTESNGNEQQREAEGRELAAAAGAGDLTELTRLVNKGASPASFDYDRRTPLHTACVVGNIAICKFLLSFPEVNVNALDRWRKTALSEAIENRHTELAELLRGKGAVTGGSASAQALCVLAAQGNTEALRLKSLAGDDLSSGDCEYFLAVFLPFRWLCLLRPTH